ncbi:MAG: Ig-like domain-containing protein, partial [Candidatus Micrarchaeia archaeon]
MLQIRGSGRRISKHSIKSANYPIKQHGQSAMEYLVTYGWAILLIAIVMVLLYLYVIVPKVVVPSSCTFISGAYCNDMVLGTNTTSHTTKIALFLTNTQPYPIANPVLYVKINNVTSNAACSPNFVLPGGSILCDVPVSIYASLGSFEVGSLYLNATYCGLAPNYTINHICSNAPRQVYTGSFNAHAQPLISTTSSISLIPKNTTNPANNAKDPLYATVKLLGYPLKSATVNFTENNTSYSLSPNLTTTNTQGIALSYIWGTKVGKVRVNATFSGLSPASVTITFS